ncbi:hypothetical protein HHI36_013770 [Cryptolaemus montrouzieri]|uniref:Protein kinase domain-containing protein n=1 Tax=Cryptolaemus montrouzieri TaxID=559131 RepID=A0ABD2NIT5_9CUCU
MRELLRSSSDFKVNLEDQKQCTNMISLWSCYWKGTIAYAAPELLKGEPPTLKCDIYSLGITIWQMVYRKSPYEQWNDSETILYNVVKYDVRPKYEYRKDLLTKLFEKCWQRSPSCRPEIMEILDILRGVECSFEFSC